VLERALLMSDADTLEQDDFAPILPGLEAKPRTPPGARSRTLEVQQQAEREAIVAAIAAASGNKAQAARNLGISRASLYEKIGALGIGSDKH
jgi:DNA-binding NtrC family response regulator